MGRAAGPHRARRLKLSFVLCAANGCYEPSWTLVSWAASALLERKRKFLRREGMAGIGQALTTLRSDSDEPVPRPLRELYGGLVIGYRDDRSFLTRLPR